MTLSVAKAKGQPWLLVAKAEHRKPDRPQLQPTAHLLCLGCMLILPSVASTTGAGELRGL